MINPREDGIAALKAYDTFVEFLRKHPKVSRLGIDPEPILAPFKDNWAAYDPIYMFRAFLETYAAERGKTVLAEGSPTNIRNMEQLRAQFPNSYVIHIVRDPRDVILSTFKADFSRDYLLTHEALAEKYMAYYRDAIRDGARVYGDHFIRIHYEDLCTHPEREIRRICEVVGEEFEPAMLEYYKTADQVFVESEMQWKKNLLKGVMKKNFGKWKKDMKPEDVLVVEYVCGEFFERESHYELSEYSRQWPVFKRISLLLPLKLKRFRNKFRKDNLFPA